MEIVLKEDLNVARRYVKGATVDLDRPCITQISNQLGRTDWFMPKDEVRRRQDAIAVGDDQVSRRARRGK